MFVAVFFSLLLHKLLYFTTASVFDWCYGLAVASKKSATWPPLTPPGCRGERKETGRNWWIGIREV